MNSTLMILAMIISGQVIAETPKADAQNQKKKEQSAADGWPSGISETRYLSSADGTEQPALMYNPQKKEAVPLLVALHTWKGDYRQRQPQYAQWCIKNGWGMIHPDFRGGNDKPEACGSELVVKDIVSAVNFAKTVFKVDENRIYLVGASGGGHAALLMAGRNPEIWAAVSAWCPIYDLKEWHAESKKRGGHYSDMIEKACGGAPGDSPAVDREYSLRSPSSHIRNAAGIPVDINTGIADGHSGSVPVTHSLNAYNALADRADRIPDEIVTAIAANQVMPEKLKQNIDDPLYESSPALFRKISGKTRVTVFQGGHQINYSAALNWLNWQRKGQAPLWSGNISSADPAIGTEEANK
ncbi:MAG: prolyl oligopeptidase family serine peptidase [Victivallales bacterium]|jgi:pimeloyl-ACP methyl ester carboxylesterase